MFSEDFDVQHIKKRTLSLIGNAQVVKGHLSSMINTKFDLISRISKNKEIVLSKKGIEASLQQMQSISQAGSIDIFQGLTTEMLHEAMPDNNGYKVKFDLNVSRGVPSLDIYLEKEIPNGKSKSKLVVREDIVDGQGGSISNVIVSALRIISLARTSNRRFIMFDEPDCWLDQNYLKTFASVIKNISHEIGIQTIIISHKHSEFFSGGCRIIEVCKEEANRELPSKFRVLADDSDNYEVTESENKKEINKKMFMEGSGIRYVRLVNFMAFEDSTIDLCPSVNVIIGTNNYGKSILRLALKAVIDNKVNDSYIRHGADGCAVEIGLEDNAKIRWELKRVGKKKTVSYTFFHNENDPTRFLRDERGGRDEPPAYIKEALGMGLVDNFDIHLTHQKSPLFVLDPAIPDSKRAKILSLGCESDTVQEMIQEYKNMCSEANANLKEDEKRLVLNDIRIERIKAEEDAFFQAEELLSRLEDVSDKMSKTKNMFDILSGIEKCMEIKNIISDIDTNKEVLHLEKLASDVTEISKRTEETLNLGEIVGGIDNCMKILNTLSSVNDIIIPDDIEGNLNTERSSDISRVAKDIIGKMRLSTIFSQITSADVPEQPIFNTESVLFMDSFFKVFNENKILSAIPEIPIEPEIKTGSDIFERLIAASNEKKEISVGMENVSNMITDCENEYNKFVESSGGICPLCSSPLHKH